MSIHCCLLQNLSNSKLVLKMEKMCRPIIIICRSTLVTHQTTQLFLGSYSKWQNTILVLISLNVLSFMYYTYNYND